MASAAEDNKPSGGVFSMLPLWGAPLTVLLSRRASPRGREGRPSDVACCVTGACSSPVPSSHKSIKRTLRPAQRALHHLIDSSLLNSPHCQPPHLPLSRSTSQHVSPQGNEGSSVRGDTPRSTSTGERCRRHSGIRMSCPHRLRIHPLGVQM